MSAYKRFDYSQLSATAVFAQVESRPEGLSAAEAHKRLRDHGSNQLHAGKQPRPPLIGLFSACVVLLLVLAAILAAFLDTGGKTAFVLLLGALLNALFSLVLHRSGASALTNQIARLPAADARVLRSGKSQTIPASQLVLGDVVLLTQNDIVPADLRIFEEDHLIADESIMTSRHSAVRKFAHAISGPVADVDRHNLALMGTSVVSGSARGVVIATGNHTEQGRIAHLAIVPSAAQARPSSGTRYGNLFAGFVCLLAATLAATAVLAGFDRPTTLFYASALLVAITPAALLPVKAANLAATLSRLNKAGLRSKKLAAASQLGRCQVLLYDTVSEVEPACTSFRELLVGKTAYEVTASGLRKNGRPLSAAKTTDLSLLFTAAAFSSGHGIMAREKALNALAGWGRIDTAKLQKSHEEYKLFPYDAGRKLHSTVRQFKGQNFVFVQGSVEAVLAHSTELWDSGHVRKLTKADKEHFTAFHAGHHQAGSEVVALAYRVLPGKAQPHELTPETAETKLTLLGIAAMATPLQSSLPAVLQHAAETKLPVTFLTNYNPAAASAAAAAVRPEMQRSMTVVEGTELMSMSDNQLSTVMLRGDAIFCQISPEDKLRLVEILQRGGLAVAVSGDGLYDAPALARANVGIAGHDDDVCGTAGLVLGGQGFTGLLTALDISRQARHNFAAMLRCMLTTTAGKVALVLLSLLATALFHTPAVIGIVPLIAIDLLALAFPLAALSWDTPTATHRPESGLQQLFTREAFGSYIKFGLLAAGLAWLAFLTYFAYSSVNPEFIDSANELHINAATLAFLAFVLCESINVLFVRKVHSAEASRRVLLAFGCSLLLVVTMIYNPLLQPFAGTTDMQIIDWLIAALAAVLYFAARLAQRHTAKHTRREVIKLHKEIHGHNSPARI
ncbi:MAG TPA: cation transporting ATPase C-terminal domain-containing protein [Candidatus Saccharimonadales bacterium]|nr:cation transporting ATPase C-terminal domain-containing protein [Candidatus Saccharimonadales bacterium]